MRTVFFREVLGREEGRGLKKADAARECWRFSIDDAPPHRPSYP